MLPSQVAHAATYFYVIFLAERTISVWVFLSMDCTGFGPQKKALNFLSDLHVILMSLCGAENERP